MKCFYHSSTDAVGICKNCNRGVCTECAADLINGIACKDKCEAEVEEINSLINRSKTSYHKTSVSFTRNAVIYLLLGLTLIIFGGLSLATAPVVAWYLLPTGAIFLLGAFFNYSSGRKFMKNESLESINRSRSQLP